MDLEGICVVLFELIPPLPMLYHEKLSDDQIGYIALYFKQKFFTMTELLGLASVL